MLVGWLLGLAALGAVAIVLGNHTSLYGSDADAPLARWIQGIAGVGLLALAAQQWRGRDRKEQPTWMASLADVSALKAFGLGALLSAGNPKNLLLTLSAMAVVVEAGLTLSHELIVLVGFILVASIGVATPPILVALRGDKAQPMLEAWRAWLGRYSAVLMAVVLGVIGAVLLVRSLT